jgi:dTDP-4-dehydrorhamnose 3,5-epimerase/CDP-3, 6-dideoxy-D-glycero-D-glycero-4-hexulose-5-epimerase
MKLEATHIEGLFIVNCFHAKDERGTFVKTFHAESFEKQGLQSDFRESYFSVNAKNVVRGMHFQVPPHNHAKLVFCNSGAVLDVVIDLRKHSATYLNHFAIELSDKNRLGLYIPNGMAHGFLSLNDHTIISYLVTSEYNAQSDSGIHYQSIGFDWPVANPIVSERDLSFETLQQFQSPF